MTARRHAIADQIPFALYGAANRIIKAHRPFLDPLGLTFPQYLVISELLDSSPQTVGELCSTLGMDTGTLTPLLKRLQTADLVSRRRDPDDERRVLVGLTDRGRDLEDEVRAVNGRIEEACLAPCAMTEKEIEDLHRTLTGLVRDPEA